MKNKKNIVIIGGAGYIGTTVSDYFLNLNYNVKSVDNLIYNQNKPIKKKNLTFYNLDISQKNKIKNILDKKSIVVFLAGLVGDPITKKYSKISKKINEKYIIKLIDECFKKK